MLLWFLGVGVLMVWVVFQSPALDVRMVAVGLLLPWLDGVTGGPFVLHTLAGSVLLLGLVMLLTRHSRVARREWLGLPIGTFLHLTLDAAWTRTALFWWPFGGSGAFDGSLPELERSLAVLFLMELLGAAALWWGWQAFGLADPDRQAELRSSGRLRPRS